MAQSLCCGSIEPLNASNIELLIMDERDEKKCNFFRPRVFASSNG
jgi:hypothetical protein